MRGSASPEWAGIEIWAIIAGSVISAAALIAETPAAVRAETPEVRQRFPHAVHVREMELDCRDCHPAALRGNAAADTLGPADRRICLDCHEAADLPPRRIATTHDLRFAHGYHTQALGMSCQRCHAGVMATDQPALPPMTECMTCHNGRTADRDCQVCHRAPPEELVPSTHIPGWRHEHGRSARHDEETCVACHGMEGCQVCHGGEAWHTHLDGDTRYPSPTATRAETPGGVEIHRVHGLNYRFLHALDARARINDCDRCHVLDAGGLCSGCHNPASNPDLRPVWHGGPDWGAWAGAVGSGGGRHGRLARRDLESCVVCHDLPGDDPTCLLCHMDRNRGRGNDPRTHAGSFADEIGAGDFHHDDGATCFTCHVYRGATGGDGFCGYCHGAK